MQSARAGHDRAPAAGRRRPGPEPSPAGQLNTSLIFSPVCLTSSYLVGLTFGLEPLVVGQLACGFLGLPAEVLGHVLGLVIGTHRCYLLVGALRWSHPVLISYPGWVVSHFDVEQG